MSEIRATVSRATHNLFPGGHWPTSCHYTTAAWCGHTCTVHCAACTMPLLWCCLLPGGASDDRAVQSNPQICQTSDRFFRSLRLAADPHCQCRCRAGTCPRSASVGPPGTAGEPGHGCLDRRIMVRDLVTWPSITIKGRADSAPLSVARAWPTPRHMQSPGSTR